VVFSGKHLAKLLGDDYENARRILHNPYNETAADLRARLAKENIAHEEDDEKIQVMTGNVRSSTKRKTEHPAGTDDVIATPSGSRARSNGPTVVVYRKKAKSDSEDSNDEMDCDSDEAESDSIQELECVKDELLRKLEFVNQQLRMLGSADLLQPSSRSNSKTRTKSDTKGKGKVITKAVRSTTTTKTAIIRQPKNIAALKRAKLAKDASESDHSAKNQTDDEELDVPANHCVGATGRPQLLLAEKWDTEKGIDPTSWLISEKLDGVRAFWNGSEFCSREGNKFYAPDWFVKRFPKDITLDGELFAGRGTFNEASGIIRCKDQPNRWKFKIEYHVFDIPSMGNKPFETRHQHLTDLFDKLCIKWVKVVSHTVCQDKDHLMKELSRVQDLEGEGLMLRKPGSLYEGKRSKTLLKVKTFLDADAEVIGHEEGHGKNTGKCGALKCKKLDGSDIEFKVGSGLTDAQRVDPPKIGSIIIYRYARSVLLPFSMMVTNPVCHRYFEESKSGNPRFPTFVSLIPSLINKLAITLLMHSL